MKCFILLLVSVYFFGSIQLEETQSKTEKQPDYFYDSSLTDEEIEKAKNEKKQTASINQLETSTKTDPKWFKESNKPASDPFANFLDFFSVKSQANKTADQEIPPMMKEMMEKYQAEQMEKFRQSRKSNSTLNHKVLSLITLVAFFGSGILISLTFVFMRSVQFRKWKQAIRDNYGNKKNKSIYNSVNQIENHMNA